MEIYEEFVTCPACGEQIRVEDYYPEKRYCRNCYYKFFKGEKYSLRDRTSLMRVGKEIKKEEERNSRE